MRRYYVRMAEGEAEKIRQRVPLSIEDLETQYPAERTRYEMARAKKGPEGLFAPTWQEYCELFNQNASLEDILDVLNQRDISKAVEKFRDIRNAFFPMFRHVPGKRSVVEKRARARERVDRSLDPIRKGVSCKGRATLQVPRTA